MNLSDLRGILSYIARFRDKIFVLNIDSEILASDTFHNLLLDISVLRSLNIKIVLVHGISVHIKQLADELNIPASDLEGMGITDAPTLKLSVLAASRLSHEILEGLRDTDQRAVVTNAIIAHPAGILEGVDQQFTGQVERVETSFLEDLLAQGIIPVIPPLGMDGNGQTFRVNSDGVALEVSEALKAAKLMFITTSNGVRGSGTLRAQFSVAEGEDYLKKHRQDLDKEMASKLRHGVRACRNGVARVHIIDGQQDAALLSEIFSNEGIGTMIHANEYEAIRRARKKDIGAIMGLIRESVEAKQLAQRTRQDVTERINDYFVFEIDRNILGCVALRLYGAKQDACAELECLFVSEAHENQGIGSKMMHFIENQAKIMGVKRLFALSTQAFNYFQQKGGFTEGSPDMLPAERRARYMKSGRHSKVLFKDLG
ncbi:MAG TPA: amino-acid N-acetyltransferase [Kiritimatiellia bacterium]|nr:amino-acid N-acetyltransferase [Kiritimatiellia bacterium]HMO97766.1 amino-acid N-acetyltransferase [Kiritimatiellia bacterium]HMP95405.1 amino-acid N-acetyltransferase [Kiritimatiellia bacterium]